MEKTLIIVTRINGEFDSYWNGRNDNRLNGSNIPSPLQIPISSHKVLVMSPHGFGVANTDNGFGDKIKAVLTACGISLTEKQVGIIVHGSDNFNIQELGLINLAFRRSYGSTLGAGFCQSANDNFVINNDINVHRNGVLDAFRDAYILNRSDKLEEAFNNLWKYFLGDPILESKLNFLHHCLVPSGAKTAPQAKDYYLIKDLVECLKLENSEKKIIEYLSEQEEKDCFDEEKYLKHLRILRDSLLS